MHIEVSKEQFVKLFKEDKNGKKFTEDGMRAMYDFLKYKEGLILDDNYPINFKFLADHFNEYYIIEDGKEDYTLKKYGVSTLSELLEITVHKIFDQVIHENICITSILIYQKK